MPSGKIKPKNQRKLTKKLTKIHFRGMRSISVIKKGPAPYRKQTLKK